MPDSRQQPNQGKGFRLVTHDGKEKFLPIPMPLTKAADLFHIEMSEEPAPPPPPVPLAEGAGEPPSDPPQAPPAAMEPDPEPQPEPEQKPEMSQEETKEFRETRLARLQNEYVQLLSSLYWVQSEIEDLKGGK